MNLKTRTLNNAILICFLMIGSIIGSRLYMVAGFGFGVVFLVRALYVEERITLVPLIVFGFLLLISLLPILLGFEQQGGSSNSLFSIISAVLPVIFAVLVGSISTDQFDVASAVKTLGYVIISTLVLQSFYYEFFKIYLDFPSVLGIGEAKYQDYACTSDCGIRVTSYQLEPSAITSTLVALWALAKIAGDKSVKFSLAVIFGCSITFATMGLLQALLISLALVQQVFKISFVRIFGIVLLIIIAGVITYQLYFDSFIVKINSTILPRINLLSFFYDQLRSFYGFFGYGYFSESGIQTMAADESKLRTASVNDLGLFFYLFFRFGLAGLAVFSAIAYRRLGLKRFLILLPLLTVKFSSAQLLGVFVIIKFLRWK